jgi:hypothetical protein
MGRLDFGELVLLSKLVCIVMFLFSVLFCYGLAWGIASVHAVSVAKVVYISLRLIRIGSFSVQRL